MSATSKIMLTTMILIAGYGIFMLVHSPEPAQIHTERVAPAGFSVYKNNVYGFELFYPEEANILIDHTQMTSTGYNPTCDSTFGLICFFLPDTAYPESNFKGAGVSINLLPDKKTEADCLAPRAELPEQLPAQTTIINGVSFAKYLASDAAMSHQSSGDTFRTFHNNQCFEITTRINTTSFEVYELGTIDRFTDVQKTELKTTLDQVVQSFRFTS